MVVAITGIDGTGGVFSDTDFDRLRHDQRSFDEIEDLRDESETVLVDFCFVKEVGSETVGVFCDAGGGVETTAGGSGGKAVDEAKPTDVDADDSG